jgi:hypothetical protein
VREEAVVQFSDEILQVFGGPGLPKLTACGADDLPNFPNYLDSAIALFMGNLIPDRSVFHLDLTFLRRAIAACEEYKAGRKFVLDYVDGLSTRHRLPAYRSAVTHFEQCIEAVWKAGELHRQMGKRVLGIKKRKPSLFTKNDKSDLERISDSNNIIKHFTATEAQLASAPIWITNVGIESQGGKGLTFEELRENVIALFEVARITFVEIPSEAVSHAKSK